MSKLINAFNYNFIEKRIMTNLKKTVRHENDNNTIHPIYINII